MPTLLVHNPYVGMANVHIELQGLQAIGACTGYPCTTLLEIVACRHLLTRGEGIGSRCICLQLLDACDQDAWTGLDALGLVQRQQGVQVLLDPGLADSTFNQLFNFKVVQN